MGGKCCFDVETVLHQGLSTDDVQAPADLFKGETVGRPR